MRSGAKLFFARTLTECDKFGHTRRIFLIPWDNLNIRAIVMNTKYKRSKKKVLWWSLLCIFLGLTVGGVLTNAFSDNDSPLESTSETESACSSDTVVSNTSSATLYYPCVISEPLPATTLMSGNAATHQVLEWLASQMVVNGFVVLGMTPLNKFGLDSGWRNAHLSGIAKLKSLNSGSDLLKGKADLLKGKIDIDKLQLCGHSKGGGGALWAADMLGSEVKSVIAMCPWQEEFFNLSGIRAATLIQSGGSDIYATHEMTFGEYNMITKGISKAYFEYPDAHHFSWGILGSDSHHPAIGSDVVAWMKYYLKGDKSQRSKLSNSIGKSTHFWEDHSGGIAQQ